jgi:hypothetical protein
MRPVPSTVVAALLAVLAGCGDEGGPVQPRTPAQRTIDLGERVEGSLKPTSSHFYEFTVPQHGMVAVYLHALDGREQIMSLTLEYGSPRQAEEVLAVGVKPGTKRLELPAGTVVAVRVSVIAGGGSYRFTVHEVKPGPEQAGSELRWEEWAEERLDTGFDRDDFYFDAAAGDELVLFREGEGWGDNVILALFAPGETGTPLWSSAVRPSASFDPLPLPATGRYLVRVERPLLFPEDVGMSYRLMAYRIDPGPEHAEADLRAGGPVEDDLHMQHDRDEYTFNAEPGVDYVVLLTYPVRLQGVVTDPVSGERLGGTVVNGYDNRFNPPVERFRVPRAGTYRLTVSGVLAADSAGEPQRYRLELFRIDPAPEGISPRITLGQVVEGDQIFPTADIDEYEFEGSAGQTVVVHAQAPLGSVVDLLVSGGTRLARIYNWRSEPYLQRHASPAVTLPADGHYRIRVWNDYTDPTLGVYGPPGGGPYRFEVVAFTPAPEQVSAELRYGDVVDGEALYPVHDVDTFTFSGKEGDAVVLTARQIDYRVFQTLLRLAVRRSDTGEALAWLFSGTNDQTVSLLLPATGEYQIEVDTNPGSAQSLHFVGRYRLELQKGN